MNTYHPKNILVTGGAGFIGCYFVRDVLNKLPNTHLVNLDKLTYAGSLNNLTDLPNPHRHTFIRADINDRILIDKILRDHHIDTIVHFAAESHVDRSIQHPAAFIETNVLGTFQLVDAAKKYWLDECQLNETTCRFHHISTDEVFGSLSPSDPAFNEHTPYQPRSPYSASKASADHLVNAYYHTYGLPITMSNCSNNYGPHQHAEKFIPTVIQSCFMRQPIPIYGNGKNVRDWLYVADHCEGILAIIQRGKIGESYVMGGGCELENLTVAKMICHEFDMLFPQFSPHENLISLVTDRLGHDFRYAIDYKKMTDTLNWSPRHDFREGLARTISFLRDKQLPVLV